MDADCRQADGVDRQADGLIGGGCWVDNRQEAVIDLPSTKGEEAISEEAWTRSAFLGSSDGFRCS